MALARSSIGEPRSYEGLCERSSSENGSKMKQERILHPENGVNFTSFSCRASITRSVYYAKLRDSEARRITPTW